MHDRLTHHYFEVDRQVLWTTITEYFPPLLNVLPPTNPATRPPPVVEP